MRYVLRLAYDGAPFHGWQRQPNASSVQQTVEEALSTLLRKETSIVGAGRTDAGVNAREMFAHFDCDMEPHAIVSILRPLNRMVGKSIAIYSVIPVRDDFHARFDACRRTYKYFVSMGKSPFNHAYSWQYDRSLDFDAMNKAAEILLDISDFTSFAKLHSDVKTNICNVDTAVWSPCDRSLIPDKNTSMFEFTISADRFLRNMVRAVVGTLIEVGVGKLDIDGFRRIIEGRDRCLAGTSMPPNPLFLWSVEYPDILD